MISIQWEDNPPPPPLGRIKIGIALDFSVVSDNSSDQGLAGEVSVEIPYSDEVLADAGISDASTLALFRYNPVLGVWEEVPGATVDAERRLVIFRTTHFSLYALMAASPASEGTSSSTQEPLPGGETQPPITQQPSTSEGSSQGSGSGGGGCFIATAAYGSYLDPHVVVLRDLRDRYLLTNPLGSTFVNFYYWVSPPLAHLIHNHQGLRVATRIVLTPVVFGVRYPYEAMGLILFLLLGGIIIIRRSVRKSPVS